MCDHCGCRVLTPVAVLMDDHDRIGELADAVRRALGAGELGRAQSEFAALVGLLVPHVRWEERGLFAELRAADEFTEHVDVLEGEHAALDEQLVRLDAADAAWPERVQALLTELDAHIYKENFGLFPGALAALDGDAWQRVEASAPARPATASG